LTFVGASFTSLGLQPEIATWEWGNNGVTDTFVVNVGDISAVPEPSSLALFCAIGLFAFSRRRKVAIIG